MPKPRSKIQKQEYLHDRLRCLINGEKDTSFNKNFVPTIFGSTFKELPNLIDNPLASKKKPEYNILSQYKEMFEEIEVQVKMNSEMLKNTSFEINMLTSALKLDDVDPIVNLIPDYKKIRIRRCESELDKDLICPYKDCNRHYASRSSLKLHMKNQHSYADPLKDDCQDAKTLLLTKCCRHDFDVDREKIICNRSSLSDSFLASTAADTNITTNSAFDSFKHSVKFDKILLEENFPTKIKSKKACKDKINKLLKMRKRLQKSAYTNKNLLMKEFAEVQIEEKESELIIDSQIPKLERPSERLVPQVDTKMKYICQINNGTSFGYQPTRHVNIDGEILKINDFDDLLLMDNEDNNNCKDDVMSIYEEFEENFKG